MSFKNKTNQNPKPGTRVKPKTIPGEPKLIVYVVQVEVDSSN